MHAYVFDIVMYEPFHVSCPQYLWSRNSLCMGTLLRVCEHVNIDVITVLERTQKSYKVPEKKSCTDTNYTHGYRQCYC